MQSSDISALRPFWNRLRMNENNLKNPFHFLLLKSIMICRVFIVNFFLLLFPTTLLIGGEGITQANEYQKNSDLQWQWAMDSLASFSFNENEKVLDLGCGNGKITAYIAEKVPLGIVVGLDISATMLALARQNYSADNLLYMHGDARSLPFVDQFDKVTALLSFNWIMEQQQALNSLYKVLKPGGRALLILPGKLPSSLGNVTVALVQTERWAPYFPDFKQVKFYASIEEYVPMLESANLKVNSTKESDDFTYFADKTALIGFFRPLCNYIDQLSHQLQEEFIEEIVQKVLTYDHPLDDGSILLHSTKVEVIVSKSPMAN